MPDSVELNLQKVLGGLPLNCEEAEICDFSLEKQNEALESQGFRPNVDPKYKPVLNETVNYIVACILINDENEVLMIQEAKTTCAGKWYLPAGRVDKGENLINACKREVLEETGLHVDCTTLILIETAAGNWMRFVLTGEITGGKLKTPADADKESIQAKWVKNIDGLELRAGDILHIIDRARLHREARKVRDSSWFQDQLPALQPYEKQLLRLIIVIKKKSTNSVHILLSERTSWHFPTCEIHPSKSLHSTLRRFMIDLFGAEVPSHRPCGLLSVEHDSSSGKDGVCLTLLVAFRAPLEEVPIIGKCVWHEISKEIGDKLLHKVTFKNATIPLHVIK